MEVNKLFDNIIDLPGIEGVCLFDTAGQMYVNRLPSFFSNELFADAQRRIVAMYETMDENFMPCDDYVLKFSERWLLLRRSETHVMLILGGDKANLASTRMVTNMTMKHLTPATLSQLSGKPAPAPARGSTTPPIPVPASTTAAPFPFGLGRSSTAPAVPVLSAPALAPAPAPAVATADPQKKVRMYRGQPY